MARKWVRIALVTALVVAALYLAVFALACTAYRSVLYLAPSHPPAVSVEGTTATLKTYRASDGVEVHALQYPPKLPGARFVVHFHGNAETIGSGGARAWALQQRGLGVVLAEYRGYGPSKEGKPTEAGLYADAEAVLDGLAREGVGPERIVLFGLSLGTGVATEMARRGKAHALVLVAPFTSVPRLAFRWVPFLPTSVIVRDRFDTLGKAAELRLPTLVVHGTDDEVVPYDMGVTVSKAIPSARLLTIQGGHHNDLFEIKGDDIFDAIAAQAN